MSVRRQYSLPNVSLALEGWSNATAPNAQADLAIVTGVECRFLPQQQVLAGGKELLDALTATASRYAQDILGDLHSQSTEVEVAPGQLDLRPAERSGYHRLIWQPPAVEGQAGARTEFELTTVQLFDLVEAIDQFLLDNTAVPDMAFQVAPRPQGTRRTDRPLAQQAAPAAIGVAGFAAAAAVLLLVPAPEVEVRETTAERSEDREDEDGSTASILPTGIVSRIAGIPRAEDRVELARIAAQVRRRIDTAWQERGAIREPLSYRLWATPDGEILGFEALGGDRPAATAPALPNLLALQVDPRTLPAVAELRATFNGSGTVTVEPWTEEAATP